MRLPHFSTSSRNSSFVLTNRKLCVPLLPSGGSWSLQPSIPFGKTTKRTQRSHGTLFFICIFFLFCRRIFAERNISAFNSCVNGEKNGDTVGSRNRSRANTPLRFPLFPLPAVTYTHSRDCMPGLMSLSRLCACAYASFVRSLSSTVVTQVTCARWFHGFFVLFLFW